MYNLGLDEFIAWYSLEPRVGFTKAAVSAWRVVLEARGLGSVSINVRITAVRSQGVRVGNWLSLLNTPNVRTKKRLRDRAMFAVLLGCGLRSSEVAALTVLHVQQRGKRWCIVDLIGKRNRVPTMPVRMKNAIDAWTLVAEVTEGHLFRPVHRGD